MRLFRCLAAFAILMLAAVPSGFMPVAHAGTIVLQPCPAQGPGPAPIDQAEHAHRGHHDMAADGHADHGANFEQPDCGFSADATDRMAGGEGPFLDLVQLAAAFAPDRLAPIIAAQRRAPRPPSRAPPTA